MNISSAASLLGTPGLDTYTASKGALNALTRSLAVEYAADGIRVNAIAPGPVDTDMVRNNPQAVIDAMTSTTLMKRLANPDEMDFGTN